MICLDNTDTLEGGASIDAVVDYTVHGLVGTTFTNLAQGQLSSTDPSILYTAGAAISVVSVVFVNTHTSAVTVNLYLDPANVGTPRRLIPKALSLGVGYSMHFDGAKLTILDTNGGIVSSAIEAPYTPPGSLERAKFVWKDADEIYINPGAYYLDGKWRRWNSQLTFQFGSAGSNAGSTNLGASDWFYLCLDHSTIGSNTVLIASDFIAVITEPAWSNAKHSEYISNDRCIFAVRTDGSGNILEFFHENSLCLFADRITVTSNVDPGNTWTDSTQMIPKFARKAETTFLDLYGGTGSIFNLWRTNGQSGIVGHPVGQCYTTDDRPINTLSVITDSNGVIEFKHDGAGSDTMSIFTEGWYFPIGM